MGATANERALVAIAMHADGFRPFAPLFPRQSGTRRCEVRAGPPGAIFRGYCTTRAEVTSERSGRVIFKQSIHGNHWWVIRVRQGRARLMREWGAPLVELIS